MSVLVTWPDRPATLLLQQYCAKVVTLCVCGWIPPSPLGNFLWSTFLQRSSFPLTIRSTRVVAGPFQRSRQYVCFWELLYEFCLRSKLSLSLLRFIAFLWCPSPVICGTYISNILPSVSQLQDRQFSGTAPFFAVGEDILACSVVMATKIFRSFNHLVGCKRHRLR